MISDAKKRAVAPWLPMGFCAFLSFITLFGNLWLSFMNGSNWGGGWAITFLCNLPMCFFFMGAPIARMQREISALQKQLAELAASK